MAGGASINVFTILTHFMLLVSFSITWEHQKTSENICFSDVFTGYRNRPVAWNGLIVGTSVNVGINQICGTVMYFRLISLWHKHQLTDLHSRSIDYFCMIKALFILNGVVQYLTVNFTTQQPRTYCQYEDIEKMKLVCYLIEDKCSHDVETSQLIF